MAITYNTVRGDAKTLAMFPKLEIVAAFGVGYDHVDANYAREHNIMVTNTPDVLTEEVADITMGLLICTLREFIKADRYLRSGLWTDAAISPERRLAARPQGRHRRHGPDWAGDRAPPRGLARCRWSITPATRPRASRTSITPT